MSFRSISNQNKVNAADNNAREDASMENPNTVLNADTNEVETNDYMMIDDALNAAGVTKLQDEFLLTVKTMDGEIPFDVVIEPSQFDPNEIFRIVAGEQYRGQSHLNDYYEAASGMRALSRLITDPWAIIDDGAYINKDLSVVQARRRLDNVGYISSEYAGKLDLPKPRRYGKESWSSAWGIIEKRNAVLAITFTAAEYGDKGIAYKDGREAKRAFNLFGMMSILNDSLHDGSMVIRVGSKLQGLALYFQKLWTLHNVNPELAAEVRFRTYRRALAMQQLRRESQKAWTNIQTEKAVEGGYTFIASLGGVDLVEGVSYHVGPKGVMTNGNPDNASYKSFRFDPNNENQQAELRTLESRVNKFGWVVVTRPW